MKNKYAQFKNPSNKNLYLGFHKFNKGKEDEADIRIREELNRNNKITHNNKKYV